MNACDFLLEQGADEDIALIAGADTWTYRELRSAVAVLVGRLRGEDLPDGTPVLVVGENSFFWVASYLAVMKAGLVAVPLSPRLGPDGVAQRMSWLGTRTVFADRLSVNRLELAAANVITEEALTSAEPDDSPQSLTSPDSDAVIMFTSGSTAAPKAVRVTHGNLVANTTSIIEYLSLARSDRILCVLPFFYCFGASLLHTHLRVGGSAVLCNTFAFPETAVTALRQHECTGLAGVPSTFATLLRRTTFAECDLPQLRVIQQAGGRMANTLIEELAAAHRGADVVIMYGQTEATARLSYLPPDRLPDKLGSIGRGIPGVELQVRDENGEVVAPGVRGEIWARGENISPGYLRNPEATSDKFVGGWLRTGDLATVDADGFIYIVDRKDDFIKTMGHRVSALEIEECALRLPGVAGAAAVGAPDDQADEIVALYAEMVDSSPGQVERLSDFLRLQLPRYMVPSIVRVIDRIPLNTNGKVNRTFLRELAVADRHSHNPERTERLTT